MNTKNDPKLLAQKKSIEKGIERINNALTNKKLGGPDLNCNYYKCHPSVEDCTFCFCVFYPCGNLKTGKYVKSSTTGKPVWDCSNCIFPHNASNAQKIFDALLNENCSLDKISRKRLMEIYHQLTQE